MSHDPTDTFFKYKADSLFEFVCHLNTVTHTRARVHTFLLHQLPYFIQSLLVGLLHGQGFTHCRQCPFLNLKLEGLLKMLEAF